MDLSLISTVVTYLNMSSRDHVDNTHIHINNNAVLKKSIGDQDLDREYTG